MLDKMFTLLQIALVVSLGLANGAVIRVETEPKNAWTYDDPEQWPVNFPMCGGEQQSPINLDPFTALEFDYPTFNFFNYDKAFVETVINNGHTIMLQVKENLPVQDLPYLTGGGLPGVYRFHQLHFHWGSDVSRGSEHRIADQPFPAELHIVHYNEKYGDFATASGYPDGLAVLGIMIETEAHDNIAFRHIQHFETIANPLDAQTYDVAVPIPLEDLLPDDPTAFFRYDGSLTTPECNESVFWTVFQTPIAISERQLAKFRGVFDDELRPLENNYRPVQELHNRVVSYRPASQRL
ncbi:alpha-carbonic anhydrase [Daphnia pulex]|uniref:Carbonic anhydrase n=1 Tax=Daphnia pulex TaxID=6669 RepID=E9FXL3_DAPPU|nr:alpha-carbonic anhydrase [Daphnia pulex]|eukprot:EFX88103.1 alpha-carbonic anhydrase [Daphnia pulex]